MSTERLNISDLEVSKNIKPETKRVDINTLMNKVREENKKESKHTIILFSLIVIVISFFGIVLSL